MTCDFQQCGILAGMDGLRQACTAIQLCSISSLTAIEYLSD